MAAAPTATGRVHLVTGGGAGIGAAVVARLLADGGFVASLDVCPADRPENDRFLSLSCDVTDPAAVDAAVDAVVERFGGLDAVVQCAGVTADGVLWKLDPDDWRRVLGVNLDGAFYVLRAAVPALRARGRGAVVHITSINGERGKFGQANYAASKAGLIALTKTAARELGRFGIRVNAVAPGLVRTAMTASLPDEVVERAREESALGRVAEPEDVAAAVAFLLADEARQITGVTLRVDGGQYM